MKPGWIPRVAAIASLLVIMSPGLALAHAELTNSDPAADAVLDTPPSEVVLTFGAELDPDGSSFSVTDADGVEVATGDVDLDVAERNVMRGDVAIVGSGHFAVEWTSVAIDGHTETGSFAFEVAGDDEAPDTAMAAPSSSGLLGLTFLLAATLVAAYLLRSRRTR